VHAVTFTVVELFTVGTVQKLYTKQKVVKQEKIIKADRFCFKQMNNSNLVNEMCLSYSISYSLCWGHQKIIV